MGGNSEAADLETYWLCIRMWRADYGRESCVVSLSNREQKVQLRFTRTDGFEKFELVVKSLCIIHSPSLIKKFKFERNLGKGA